MAAKKIIRKFGCVFKVYQKSMGIEGVPGVLFLGRTPNNRDLETLGRCIAKFKKMGYDEGRDAERKRLFTKIKNLLLD